MFVHVFCVLICFSSLKAAPSPLPSRSPSPSPSPPPRSEGQNDTEQPPLPPLLSSLYPFPYSPSSPTAASPPPPPTARDVSPPLQYVSRNVLPLIETRPTVRVLPFREAPPSPPLPWESPDRGHHDNIVWAGARDHPAGGRGDMPSVTPPIHPCHTNGERTTAVTPNIPHFTNGELSLGGVGQQSSIAGRPRTPAEHLEARELEEAYWNEVEDAAAEAAERAFWRGNPSPPQEEHPLNEVNQEWEDNVENNDREWNYEVDEASYEGATAYSPTSYGQSSRYGNPSINSFPAPATSSSAAAAAAAAVEGRQRLRDEAQAAALTLSRQIEERETRRRQWQYAVSRATDRITLPASLTFGDWTAAEWAHMESLGARDMPPVDMPPLEPVSPGPGPYRNPSPPPAAASPPPPTVIHCETDVSPPFLRQTPPSHLISAPNTDSNVTEPPPPTLVISCHSRQWTAQGVTGQAFAFHVGASLAQQPLRERVMLADRLRELLVSPSEDTELTGCQSPPSSPPPQPRRRALSSELMPPPRTPPPRTESDVRTAASRRRRCSRCLRRGGSRECLLCGGTE